MMDYIFDVEPGIGAVSEEPVASVGAIRAESWNALHEGLFKLQFLNKQHVIKF